MKFTLIALLAAFCVLSANAGTLEPRMLSPEEVMPFESNDFADVDGEFMDPEAFWIFSSVWWAIKAGLRTVKGFNCIIKWVCGIKESALQYTADINKCGVEACQDVTNLINANLQIIQTANNIISFKSNICASTENETKPTISTSCSVKTLSQVFKLWMQVKKAIKLAKKVPTTGPNAVNCVTEATTTLTNYYTQFPTNIKTCSKLTSN